MIRKKTKHFQKILVLIPVTGICIFIILYFYAASLYPGSIRGNITKDGFSLVSDYWCDLLDKIALNGEVNKARPAALVSTSVIFLSMAFFWYYVPFLFKEKRKFSFMTRVFGISSMILSLLIFTPYHDLILNLSGLLGFTAFILTLIGLSHAGKNTLFSFGFFCMILVFTNFVIWQSKALIGILPVLQKFTFLICFIWVIFVNLEIYHKIK